MQITVKTHRKTFKNAEAEHVSLNRRDVQLAHMVSEGRLNKEISYSLGIAEGTVKVYMSHLFAKLGIGNRAELAAWTVRNEQQLSLCRTAGGDAADPSAEQICYRASVGSGQDLSGHAAWPN